MRNYGTTKNLPYPRIGEMRIIPNPDGSINAYAQREDVVIGASVAALPNGADYLLQPFKVYA